jgi:hypothetical protein
VHFSSSLGVVNVFPKAELSGDGLRPKMPMILPAMPPKVLLIVSIL